LDCTGEEDPYKNLLSILANCVIGKSHEWAMQDAQTWVNIVENFNFQKYGSSASDAEFGRKVAEDIDHLSRSLGSPAFEIIESGVHLEQLESEMNFKLGLMDEEHVPLTAIKNRFVEKPSEVLTECRVTMKFEDEIESLKNTILIFESEMNNTKKQAPQLTLEYDVAATKELAKVEATMKKEIRRETCRQADAYNAYMNEISNATLSLGTIDKELAHAVAVQTLLHGARHAMDLIAD
jgi:hypothetical protein